MTFAKITTAGAGTMGSQVEESFWREASRHAPARTVFTTNTSTLPPSAFLGFVDRPRKPNRQLSIRSRHH